MKGMVSVKRETCVRVMQESVKRGGPKKRTSGVKRGTNQSCESINKKDARERVGKRLRVTRRRVKSESRGR